MAAYHTRRYRRYGHQCRGITTVHVTKCRSGVGRSIASFADKGLKFVDGIKFRYHGSQI